jgi:hypothetical protein
MEMYGSLESKVLESREENGREDATLRPGRTTGEDREKGPYVVRDLTWDFARYLGIEDLRAST